ncbi:hypothetical protein BBK82_35370 [Lentzea guizhouensis]|uniref:Condensation domain-containing protein n=1 Tax=Lentzea guizhouensis TaxID=1586287 RepID=A0A1B2HS44_9PSEU|nr:condensation domain-containing protein [Lentzea guizhouensis]ANZ40508.1 hypothetical protein BBK82_35370 [Lentzea guizhouensis]
MEEHLGDRLTSVAAERVFALNHAQRRVLRNWSVEERPGKVVEIIVAPPGGCSADAAHTALHRLIAAHEALRSRLAHDSNGTLVQQVVDATTAARTLGHHHEELDDSLDPGEVAARLRPHPVDPEKAASHCTLYTVRGRVRVVMLSVSHVFADGVSQQLLVRTLEALLTGVITEVPAALQAGAFSDERVAAVLEANTAHWRKVLLRAPRACTYSGGDRGLTEVVRSAGVVVESALQQEVRAAAGRLRTSPFVIWTTAAQLLTSALCGRHDLVFRCTTANRTRAAEFGVVAQLAQAVYPRVDGGSADTVGERVRQVHTAVLAAQHHGVHDAAALLDWLDSPGVRAGAVFKPAFEINHAAALRADLSTSLVSTTPVEEESSVRVDPPAANADLAVSIWEEQTGAAVVLSARPPAWRQREPARLLADLLATARHLCQAPQDKVTDVAVEPLPAVAGLLHGHHSGVSLDVATTRDLLLSHPAVVACDFSLHVGDAGRRLLRAEVRLDVPTPEHRLREWYAGRQRRLSGAVVPDELVLIAADELRRFSGQGGHPA